MRYNPRVRVQEYGALAEAPNRSTCYLSYLDSVKYFRPDGRSGLADVALRTLVYHEARPLLLLLCFGSSCAGAFQIVPTSPDALI